jgi:integrase
MPVCRQFRYGSGQRRQGSNLRPSVASSARSDDAAALVLGASRRTALGYTGLRKRSAKALATAGLKPVTLHEARHSFPSYLAASGIGIKDLTVILGHSSVTVSLDRYGHLFDAGKAQTAAQINAWLEAADTQCRVAEQTRSSG